MPQQAEPSEDPFDEEFDDADVVYTSASRPLPLAATPAAPDPDFDDGDARPAAPPSRRPRKKTRPFGDSDFEAPTRMTTLDEQLL